MTVALVFPPTCDPTAPYVSVPLLAGWLRANGVTVVSVDANVGACDFLLRPEALSVLRARVEERYRVLNRRPHLTHTEQGQYLNLLDRLSGSADLEGSIDAALRCLRGKDPGFYDPDRYEAATDVVERSLALVSAAYAPLELTFASYRSPFSLLTPEERAADSGPGRNPYHDYYGSVLIPGLLEQGVSVVGISVVFPGQIQPAYSLAHAIKRHPDARGVHVSTGGPAMSQILARLGGAARERALAPFDTAVLYEGEAALLAIVRDLEAGRSPRGVVTGTRVADLATLPAPDFDGFALDRYLSPEPVLPYDFTRGCPWGRCAFCHYGLADTGTAPYRERPLDRVIEHLSDLRRRHGTRLFYLSQDSVRPESLVALSDALRRSGTAVRWSTDVRPERLLADAATARALHEGGALSFSFGVESGSPRVLKLIRKGIPLDTVRAAIRSTAAAGIAAEAMVFTDFPTETAAEALETMALLDELGESISLFMCGTFGLTSGSAVARDPASFGIQEIWTVAGDELGLGLQYAPRAPWKSARQRRAVEDALAGLSRRWRFAIYPWAGSLSTAHTMLWYDRLGPGVFRRLAEQPSRRRRETRGRIEAPRYDVERLAPHYERGERAIWNTMVGEERAVSRARYEELAAAIAPGPEASSSAGSSSRAAAPRRGGGGPGSRPRARPRPRAGGDR